MAGAEIVVDTDGLLINFWRYLQRYAGDDIGHMVGVYSEDDIEARHRWLVGHRRRIYDGLRADPTYCDLRAALYWWQGASAWLGSGWATAVNPDQIARQRPHVDRTLKGLYARGLTDTRLAALSARLANVMLLSGDWNDAWRRCVTDSILRRFSNDVGIFLDPPYTHATGRTEGLYADDRPLSADVQEFATRVGGIGVSTIGDDEEYRQRGFPRIVVAGYRSEYPMLAEAWRTVEWRRPNGYGSTAANEARRETDVLFLSPACHGVDNPDPVG
jgi:hypothetical protein